MEEHDQEGPTCRVCGLGVGVARFHPSAGAEWQADAGRSVPLCPDHALELVDSRKLALSAGNLLEVAGRLPGGTGRRQGLRELAAAAIERERASAEYQEASAALLVEGPSEGETDARIRYAEARAGSLRACAAWDRAVRAAGFGAALQEAG